jgi:hypothetical protein
MFRGLNEKYHEAPENGDLLPETVCRGEVGTHPGIGNRCAISASRTRRQLMFAISKVYKGGCSLSEAQIGQGILKNLAVLSFLTMCEASGTLHCKMRKFIARQRQEVENTMDYWIRNISVVVYIGTTIWSV